MEPCGCRHHPKCFRDNCICKHAEGCQRDLAGYHMTCICSHHPKCVSEETCVCSHMKLCGEGRLLELQKEVDETIKEIQQVDLSSIF